MVVNIVRRWVIGLWKLVELWTRLGLQGCLGFTTEGRNWVSTVQGGVPAMTPMLKLAWVKRYCVNKKVCIPDFRSWLCIYRWKWIRMSGCAPQFLEATLGSFNDSMHVGESKIHGNALCVHAVLSRSWMTSKVPVPMLHGWILPTVWVPRWALIINCMISDLGHAGWLECRARSNYNKNRITKLVVKVQLGLFLTDDNVIWSDIWGGFVV